MENAIKPHLVGSHMLERQVRVALVGVGGIGAQMAALLARLDIAMRAKGHPHGLTLTAYDGATVSEANVGRQVFSSADIGHNKAVVTIHRLNLFYGLAWQACPLHLDAALAARAFGAFDLVLSCVDTRAARRELHHVLFGRFPSVYWGDLGNTEAGGQVVLGQTGSKPASHSRLPCVTEIYPELLTDTSPEDNRRSCSVRLSLASQGLFVNDFAARYAAQLLYELFSDGQLEQHGVLYDLAAKRSAPLPVDPATWRRLGVANVAEG